MVNLPTLDNITGINRLCTLLKKMCKGCGVYYHTSVLEFLQSERKKKFLLELEKHEQLIFLIETLSKRRFPITDRDLMVVPQLKSLHFSLKRQLMNLQEHVCKQFYRVAVDCLSYCHKYSHANNLFEGFLYQIAQFIGQGMWMVYVFDGKSPQDKKDTKAKRHPKKKTQLISPQTLSVLKKDIESMDANQMKEYNTKHLAGLHQSNSDESLIEEVQNFVKTQQGDLWDHDIFPSDIDKSIAVTTTEPAPVIERSQIDKLKKMFTEISAPYIVAKGEADDVMVDLGQCGITDVCLSDDMDLLPKGCENLIQITREGRQICVIQYVLSDILKTLNLTRPQFVDLCILMGSDYYQKFLPKTSKKNEDLLTIFSKHPSIESFVEYYGEAFDSRILDHKDEYCRIRKYFIRDVVPDSSHYAKLAAKTINIEKFLETLTTYDVELSMIELDNIKMMIKPKSSTNENSDSQIGSSNATTTDSLRAPLTDSLRAPLTCSSGESQTYGPREPRAYDPRIPRAYNPREPQVYRPIEHRIYRPREPRVHGPREFQPGSRGSEEWCRIHSELQPSPSTKTLHMLPYFQSQS